MSNNQLTIQGSAPVVQFETLFKTADVFAKSQIVPTAFRGKPADVFVALQWGTELGLQPMNALQNIYVVNGRPTLSAQVMMGLLKGRADYGGAEIQSSPTSAKCTIKRIFKNGTVETQTGEFTIEQARAAKLTGKDNWVGYPQQMLEARAIAFAARKAYPDVLAGVYTSEEVQDFEEPKNVTPVKTQQAAQKAAKASEPEPVHVSQPAAEPAKEVAGAVEDARLGKRRQELIAMCVQVMQSEFITDAEREHAGQFLRGCKNPNDIEDIEVKKKILAYMDSWELQIEKRTFGNKADEEPATETTIPDELF